MLASHRLYAALAAALLVLALGGCSSEDGSPKGGEPTTSAPTTSATPAEPTPPDLPVAATAKTSKGAEAFVRYYWHVVDFAMTSGELDSLHSLHGPRCEACRRGMTHAEELHQAGGHQVGGASVVSARTHVWNEDGRALVATRVTTAPGSEFYGRDDPRNQTFPAGQFTYLVHCRWLGGSWSVVRMEPR